jgi:hypothetical protein
MSEERQGELWADCIFVFDTSALLALYLYPEATRKQIYEEIFEKIKDRLWIPHHVYFEYLKNRFVKIREPIYKSYMPLKEDFIRPLVDSFSKSLNRVDAMKNNIKHADSHPHMVSEAIEVYEAQLKEFLKTTEEFEKTFSGQMDQKINEILLLEKNDTVFQHIQQYFKVGREYTYDEILKITAEGKHRYEFKIPPGYEDLKDKIGTQIFGDLIIWKQILEYSKESGKHIVFISNDAKEDWWELVNDKNSNKKRTNGPRKELIKEIKDHSGSAFWMYNQAKFLDIANTLIRSNISHGFIDQLSRSATTGIVDKYLVYTCEACGEEDATDTSILGLKFEAEKTNTEKGIENKYRAHAQFSCRHCGNDIHAVFEVWEHPLGIIHQQQTRLKGATLIKESTIGDDSLTDVYDKNYTPEEETYVINKKQVRLKKGKWRKIVFKKTIDASDTIFQVEYRKPLNEQQHARLQIEANDDHKKKATKTLILESGITRFVMRRDEEQLSQHFVSIQLCPDTDMTIVLSVIEFPGTGRYIEKLYY